MRARVCVCVCVFLTLQRSDYVHANDNKSLHFLMMTSIHMLHIRITEKMEESDDEDDDDDEH